MSIHSAALILAWVALALLAFALAGVLRQVRLLSGSQAVGFQSAGPAAGGAAPALERHPWAGAIHVLLFLDQKCMSCRALLPAYIDLAQRRPDICFHSLYPAEPISSNREGTIVHTQSRRLFAEYRVTATPFAVRVSGTGMVLAATPIGSEAALSLFVTAVPEGSVLNDDYAV